MNIKVLGPGCANCKRLEKNVQLAVKELGIDAKVEKVTDMSAFAQYGAMSSPALVVDEELKLTGKVPSPEEIKRYLL
jgi:small redox-active disulfide protein 2